MQKTKMEELLNQKFNVNIGFKNITSGTSLNVPPQMISFTSNSCCLILPTKSCSLGHKILLEFIVDENKTTRLSNKKIEVLGNVIEIVPVEVSSLEVVIQFNQFVKEEWQSIVSNYEHKQEHVTSVLKELKKL